MQPETVANRRIRYSVAGTRSGKDERDQHGRTTPTNRAIAGAIIQPGIEPSPSTGDGARRATAITTLANAGAATEKGTAERKRSDQLLKPDESCDP